MKKLRILLILSLMAMLAVNVFAQAYTLNPSHIVSNNARGTEKVVFTNTGNNSITFELKAVETTVGSTPSKSKSVGSEMDTESDFVSFLQNQTGGVSWLSVTPSEGIVLPGQSVEFSLTFQAMDISKALSAHVLVTTNLQLQPHKIISVNLFENASRNNCVFFTGTDNENNAYTGTPDGDMDYYLYNGNSMHPIEFNIFVDETNITSAQLSILAWDVDETGHDQFIGELDEVRFNGNFVGYMTGANEQWSTSVFLINPAWVIPGPGGKNVVQIIVDLRDEGWAIEVDWGQLVVNECAGLNAAFRYINLNGTCFDPGSQVCADIEVDTELPSQSVRVEYNLLNENMINIDGASTTYTTYSNIDDFITKCLTIPVSATPGSIYHYQVILYDAATNLQEDIDMIDVPIAPCEEPVPVSDWALFIGIALILTFAIIRFRRMI